MEYPKTSKVPFSFEMNGQVISDDLQWLEDANSAETLAWVQAQNDFTDKWFSANIDGVGERAERSKAEAAAGHYKGFKSLNDKYFALRCEADGIYRVVVLDRELKNERTIATSQSFATHYQIYAVTPCPADNGVIALFVQPDGAVAPTCLIYDYLNKKEIAALDKTFSYAWDKRDRMLAAVSQAHPESGVNENSIVLYDPADNSRKELFKYDKNSPFLMINMDRAGKYALVGCRRDYAVGELLELDCDSLTSRFLSDGKLAKYEPCGNKDGYHYVLTDQNAPMGKIIRIKTGGGTLSDAQTVIPESGRMLKGAITTEQGLFTLFMEDARSRIELYSYDGALIKAIALPDDCGNVGMYTMSAFEVPARGENEINFTFESFTCPPTVYTWNELSGEMKKLYAEKEVDIPADIVTEQSFVTARDGERIPCFIVHKRGIPKDGSAKVLMYGYGGYALAMMPTFKNLFLDLDIYKWVMQGGIYVNCNMRGGNEYGAKWHRAGNLDNKINVFNDFIDTAEWLIGSGWTKKGNIAICGGSNGGLLMTAVTTMRPDLWGAVIASVPHTDMLRFALDDRGPMYITEYGDPRDAGMFEYMCSYSPYHNIGAVKYPPMYIQTGELDNNVPPYHAKKFAARVQELNESGAPVLLRVLAKGAHDRGSGDVMHQTAAEMQAFISYFLEV